MSVNEDDGAGVSDVGAILALRADFRVRAVVLQFHLGGAFDVVTCFVHWPGHPHRSGIHDYLAPLLLHHFVILDHPGASA